MRHDKTRYSLTSLGLRLVADVAVLVTHADHDAGITGASDDGGKDGTRGVVAGEPGLAHACRSGRGSGKGSAGDERMRAKSKEIYVRTGEEVRMMENI